MSPNGSPCIAQSPARRRGLRRRVPRAHLINGLVTEGLLAEVFSNEGIGTLVYANEYRQIRPAKKKDAASIHRLSREAMNEERLVARSEEAIEELLEDYFLFEIDDNPLPVWRYTRILKKASVNWPIYSLILHTAIKGPKLVQFIEDKAHENGLEKLVTLSTQSFAFFTNKLGYTEGSPNDLPAARQSTHQEQGRNSKVLIKKLN